MAIANSDGSIILSTKVDPSGLNKGMSQMQGKATSLTKTFSKLGVAIASAFAIQKIIQFSNKAGQLATQTEASVQRLVDIYGTASDSVGDFIDANARALGMSKAAAASFSSVYGNLFSVWADQATNAELTNRYLNMTAVVASKTGRTVEDVQERVRSGLLGNTEAIEDLGIFVNIKTIEITDAFQRMANGKSWEQLDAYTQQQIRSMAILEQATEKYGDEVAETSATIRNRYKAAYEDFKNSWGNIVNTILIPVLTVLTEIFNILTAGFNALTGKSGEILENSEKLESNSSVTAENIEEQTDAQKDLNKEMKKTLAGFDDIQILSSNIADENSGNTSNALPDLPSGENKDYDPSKSISKRISKIMKVVGEGLAAIGLILLFTGNIGWGIGFIIGGASLFGVTAAAEGSTDADTMATERLTTIMSIVEPSLAAIGLILLFLGLIPWGLGFIVAGAGMFSVSELIPSGGDTVRSGCDAILAFLAGLVAYLITQAILKNWGTFVKLWGDFRALTQLMKTEGVANTIKTLFGDSLSTMQLWGLAIGVIVGGISYLALNWDKLAPAQKTITILSSLAAAATAAAVAIALFHTAWSVGIAAAAIAGGVALLAGTYLFKSYNGKKDLTGSGTAPNSIDQYAYLAKGGTYKLPALANGAVLPPNKPFLAVVGDQKQGTNIEAPADLIKQMVVEAIGEMGGNFGIGNTEVVLEIDGRELGRAIIEQGDRENRRIGTRMVTV